MKLFPYLAARTKLTFEEIAYYYGIKNTIVKPYDEHNPEHEENMRLLYSIVFGGHITEEIERTMYKSKGWSKYGFQNENPRTDFRASGILGLKQIIYFYQNYSQYVHSMTREPMFFFALCSI